MTSLQKRRMKQLNLALASSSPSDYITQDGQYQEGDVQISKTGMSITSPSTPSRSEMGAPPLLKDDEVQLDNLDVLEDLGRGSGGVVKKARHKISRKLMALKIIPLDVSPDVRKRLLLELKTLYQAQSPHIVNFFGAFFTEGHIYLCLELMDGGSLHGLLEKSGPFPEPAIAVIAKQVLLGLLYLHRERHLIHRDVKPSNILVSTTGEVKISDFGVSGQLASSISSCVSWVGTVTYMSPERIQGRSYSTQSDIWSLGLSVFELALGRFPYLKPGANLQTQETGLGFWDLLDTIVQQESPQLPSGAYSSELSDFISACLAKVADQRPSASDLLEHPFLKKWESSDFDLGQWVRQFVPTPKDGEGLPERRMLRSRSKELIKGSTSSPSSSSTSSSTSSTTSSSATASDTDKKVDGLSMMMRKLF